MRRTLDSGELSAPGAIVGLPTPANAAAIVRRERVAWSAAAIALLAVVAGSIWVLSRPVPTLPLIRFEVSTPASSDPTSFALSPDGGELVFAAATDGASMLWVRLTTRLMAVSVTVSADGKTVDASAPVALFPTRLASGAGFAPGEQQYAVAPDGRFLLNTVVDEPSASPITVVLNWTAAVKE